MISIIQRYGTDPLEYARKLNVSPQSIQNLPFVIVYGRMDGGITVYGANVLVYQIKEALERSAFLTEYFTGNFFMKKTEDSDLNPIFEIYLELRNDEIIPDAHITSQEIYLNLKTISAEYNALSESLGEKTMPVVKFLTNGSFLDTHKIRYTK
jgi:phenylacetate-CoA ligase